MKDNGLLNIACTNKPNRTTLTFLIEIVCTILPVNHCYPLINILRLKLILKVKLYEHTGLYIVYNEKRTNTNNPLELWNLLVEEHMGKFDNVITGTQTITDIRIPPILYENPIQQSLKLWTKSNGVSELVISRMYMDSEDSKDDQLIEQTASTFKIRNKDMLYSIGFIDIDEKFHKQQNVVAITYAIKSRYVSTSNDRFTDTLTYFGGYSERGCHGYGVTTYMDGGKYSGQWDSGVKSGFGIMVYKSGLETYSGQWFSDDREGEGMLDSWYDGYRYEGWWSMNMYGSGVVKWRNGETLTGLFRDQLTIPRDGVLTLQNGDVYTGQFVRGYMLFNVSVRYKNGDLFEGKFDCGIDHINLITCELCHNASCNEYYCDCVAPSGDWFCKVKFMVGNFTQVGHEPTSVKWDTTVRKIDNGR